MYLEFDGYKRIFLNRVCVTDVGIIIITKKDEEKMPVLLKLDINLAFRRLCHVDLHILVHLGTMFLLMILLDCNKKELEVLSGAMDEKPSFVLLLLI